MKQSTKSKVLEILRKNESSPVSGEDLAALAGVSRNAVWKAVNSLRKTGYQISAKRNSGYILKPSNVLSREAVTEFLNDKTIAERLEFFESVTSTNTIAKQYAAENGCGAPLEKIFIANEQTAGRGRRGRSFYSPVGTGAYMSLLLSPGMGAAEAVKLTTATSVAVCAAIEAVSGLKPEIKWVNDVYLNNKKICGILTEAVTDFETGEVESAVIGIGVNVFTEEFPREIMEIAGSMGASSDKLDRNRLIAEIINSLMRLFTVIDNKLVINDYIDEYKKRSMVIGRRIKIINTGETAEALDIDENGGLIVMLDSGEKRTLTGGEISIRTVE